MKNPFSGLIVVGLLLVAFFTITNSVYTVHQTEQALVLRFGEPAPGRALVPDPGIHFKLPFIVTTSDTAQKPKNTAVEAMYSTTTNVSQARVVDFP